MATKLPSDAGVTIPTKVTYAGQMNGLELKSSILDPMLQPVMNMDLNSSELWVNTSSGNNTGIPALPALVSLTYPSMPAMVIVGTLLIGLAFATAFGNFLVLLALLKYRNLRSLSNYLIGNLACSDFLLAMTILPLSAVQECLGHWVFGEVMCYFWLCTDVLYCTASIWNLCVIAFVRFTATLYPVWYREHSAAAKQAAIYICVVWVFSVAICIPPLLGWNDLSGSYIYSNETNVYQCVLFQTKSYVIYSAMGSFYIPFMLTVFLYIRIFGVLYSRMNRMKESSRAKKAVEERMALPTPPTVNPITVEATNPLCAEKGDIEMIVQAPVRAPDPCPRATAMTDAMTQKPLLQTDSDDEDDSGLGKQFDNGCKNGAAQHNDDDNEHNEHDNESNDGKQSARTLAVCKPTFVSSKTDKDDGKIVVCAEANGKNNNTTVTPITTAPSTPATTTTIIDNSNTNTTSKDHQHHHQHHPHNISSFLKPGKLFHRSPPDEQKKKTKAHHKRHDQREMRATIRMAIIIACFCGCWIGFFTSYLVRGIVGEENFHMPRGLDAFFFWLGYSNSGMNPILYTIFNDDFRRAFQKLLGCRVNDRHGAGPAYGKTRS